jgi:hypothetical protein
VASCVQVRCRLTCGLEMFAKDRDAHERDVCPNRLVRGSVNELCDSVIETQGTDGGASLPYHPSHLAYQTRHGYNLLLPQPSPSSFLTGVMAVAPADTVSVRVRVCPLQGVRSAEARGGALQPPTPALPQQVQQLAQCRRHAGPSQGQVPAQVRGLSQGLHHLSNKAWWAETRDCSLTRRSQAYDMAMIRKSLI